MQENRKLRIIFISFAIAQFITLLGDRLHQFSVVGMIGKVAPGSSVDLFQFGVFSYLPMLLLAPLFGTLVDRHNRITILVVVDAFRGLIVLSMPSLYHMTGSLYAFYVATLVLSLANLLFAPAKSAAIPEIFGSERLLRINAILWGLGIGGTMAGFAAGGWLFDFHSWEWGFYTDGISYLVSVIFLIPLFWGATRITGVRPSASLANIVKAAREGFLTARRQPPIAFALAAQALGWGALGILFVIGIAHVQAMLPPDHTIYLSFVALAGTFGLLVGSGITSWLGGVLSAGRLVGGSMVVLAAGWIGLSLSHGVVALAGWTFVLGLCNSPVFVVTETMLQGQSAREFRGRIFALREVATKVMFLAASSLATIADTFLDRPTVMFGVGVLLAITGVLLGRNRFPSV